VIEAETTPLIDDLINDFFDPTIARTREIVEAFTMDQGNFCKAILERYHQEGDDDRAAEREIRKLSA
jgi:hypothetical protein